MLLLHAIVFGVSATVLPILHLLFYPSFLRIWAWGLLSFLSLSLYPIVDAVTHPYGTQTQKAPIFELPAMYLLYWFKCLILDSIDSIYKDTMY